LARLQAPDASDSNHPGTILTRGNTVMGTPDFLSPEQARSLHKTDIRSDLYSLGCTFFYLLTGQVLFPGGSSLDKLIRHSTEAPPSLAQLRPDTPPEVVAIVERLLAKHPRDRYQTPAELAQALEPFAESGPTPWAPLPQTADILDDSADMPTGAISDDSAERAAAVVEDDLSALVNTVSHDTSPTPVAAPSGRVRARRPKSSWPLWLTLFCALAFLFVVGLAGGLAILLHLLGRL
jgi:serine/threonine-protein kinase